MSNRTAGMSSGLDDSDDEDDHLHHPHHDASAAKFKGVAKRDGHCHHGHQPNHHSHDGSGVGDGSEGSGSSDSEDDDDDDSAAEEMMRCRQPELMKVESASGVCYYRKKVVSRVNAKKPRQDRDAYPPSSQLASFQPQSSSSSPSKDASSRRDASGEPLRRSSDSSGEGHDKIPKAWVEYAIVRGFPIPGKKMLLRHAYPRRVYAASSHAARGASTDSTQSSNTEKSLSVFGIAAAAIAAPHLHKVQQQQQFAAAHPHLQQQQHAAAGACSSRELSRGDSSGSSGGVSLASSRFGFSSFGSESGSSLGCDGSDANLAVSAAAAAAAVVAGSSVAAVSVASLAAFGSGPAGGRGGGHHQPHHHPHHHRRGMSPFGGGGGSGGGGSHGHHGPLRQSSSPTLGTPRHRSLSSLVVKGRSSSSRECGIQHLNRGGGGGSGGTTVAGEYSMQHLTTPNNSFSSSPPRSPLSCSSGGSSSRMLIPSLSLSTEDDEEGSCYSINSGGKSPTSFGPASASSHKPWSREGSGGSGAGGGGGGSSPSHPKNHFVGSLASRGRGMQQSLFCDETGHLTAHPEIEIIAPSDEEDGFM